MFEIDITYSLMPGWIVMKYNLTWYIDDYIAWTNDRAQINKVHCVHLGIVTGLTLIRYTVVPGWHCHVVQCDMVH